MQTGGTDDDGDEEEEVKRGLDSVQYFRVSQFNTGGLRGFKHGTAAGGGSSGGSMSPVCNDENGGRKQKAMRLP